MKMLEKDVCEKQDALVSLRQQLDDLRALKHELAFKLQVREVQGMGSYKEWARTRNGLSGSLNPRASLCPSSSLESHFKYRRKEWCHFEAEK